MTKAAKNKKPFYHKCYEWELDASSGNVYADCPVCHNVIGAAKTDEPIGLIMRCSSCSNEFKLQRKKDSRPGAYRGKLCSLHPKKK